MNNNETDQGQRSEPCIANNHAVQAERPYQLEQNEIQKDIHASLGFLALLAGSLAVSDRRCLSLSEVALSPLTGCHRLGVLFNQKLARRLTLLLIFLAAVFEIA
jgi:hypothetical protein